MRYRLIEDERALGLERRVVETAAGPVVVRAGAPAEGPGLLLVHGAAGSWSTWTPLLQHAAETRRPRSGVVAVDLPGWGASPAPRTPLDPGGAADALAEVARAVGHDRWTVVGHSLGGFVALELAVREPTATAGVLLVSPTGPAVVRAIRRPLLGGARLPWFAGMLLAMRALAAAPALLGLARPLLGPLSRPLFAAPVDPSVRAAFADELRPSAFLAAARAAADYDLGRWQRVACPALSVRGERDVFAGEHDAEALRRLVPGFAEQRLPDAGHFAAIERPDAVLDALARLGPS